MQLTLAGGHQGLGARKSLRNKPLTASPAATPCLELAVEDLADNNEYGGRCLHCQREITARSAVAAGSASAVSPLWEGGWWP